MSPVLIARLHRPALSLLLAAGGLGACEPPPPPMDTPDRSTLTVALQEGFDGDHVVVESGGEVVADLPAVTTDVRIGLAHEVKVAIDAWPAEVRVTLPDRGLHEEVHADGGQAVGVSVVDGRLVARVSERPFGYL